MKILGMSGSLRRESSNTQLLEAAGLLLPPGSELVVGSLIEHLPHFSPDLEGDPAEVVLRWRAQAEEADAILICCPEYAGGIPGSFKNALDWLVGCMAMFGKPTAIVNASPSSVNVQGALRFVLAFLSARIIEDASIAVPLRGRKLDARGIASMPEFAIPLSTAIARLIEQTQTGPDVATQSVAAAASEG